MPELMVLMESEEVSDAHESFEEGEGTSTSWKQFEPAVPRLWYGFL